MLRDVLSSIKWTLLNLLRYALNVGKRRAHRTRKPMVVIDLQRDPYDRYLKLLILFFNRTGYEAALRLRRRTLANWNTHVILRNVPSIRLLRRLPDGTVLIISDARIKVAGYRCLYMHPDYFSPDGPQTYRIPMPMVDSVYRQSIETPPPPPSGHPLHDMGRIPVFYTGGFKFADYARPELGRAFGVMNRPEMRRVLQETFADAIASPKSLEDLARETRPIRIIDRHLDFYVPPLELRWVFERTDFFPAFPGVAMPWTHAIIEGMSMGAIPILQYPQLFDPPLEPGVNCLAFADATGLVAAINEALAMPRERIDAMRARVKAYYREHLSPEVVVARIMADVPGRTELKLMAEHTSVRLLLQRRDRTSPA